MSPHGRAARRETRLRYKANNGAENRRAAATAGTPAGAGRDKNDGDAPSQGPKGKRRHIARAGSHYSTSNVTAP